MLRISTQDFYLRQSHFSVQSKGCLFESFSHILSNVVVALFTIVLLTSHIMNSHKEVCDSMRVQHPLNKCLFTTIPLKIKH